jgi:hypothetical protein
MESEPVEPSRIRPVIKAAASILLLTLSFEIAFAAPRPEGRNCAFTRLPAKAEIRPGFEGWPTARYPPRGFPSKQRWMNHYTGCSSLWEQKPDGWEIIGLSFVKNGDVVQWWWNDPNIEPDRGCFYKDGHIVDANVNCGMPDPAFDRKAP